MRKVAAVLLCAVIFAGGMIAMALAGILAAVMTDPFYSFWLAFVPFGGAVALLTAWLAGKLPIWLYPAHPHRPRWTRIAQAVSLAVSLLWGYGVADVLTSPMNWQ